MSTGISGATAPYPQGAPKKWDTPSCSWLKLLGIGSLVAIMGYAYAPNPEFQRGTEILQTVAKRLHVDDETAASFRLLPMHLDRENNDTEGVAYVDRTSTVFLNATFYPVLLESDRLDSSQNFTQQEIQGILAHEVSHVVLGHLTPSIAPATIVTAEEPEEVRLYRIKRMRAESRDNEKAADLHTLKDPWLAQGLLQVFVKWSQNTNRTHSCFPIFSTHPSYERRIQYLEDGLCRVAPENDPDRCFVTVAANDPVLNGRLSERDKRSISWSRSFERAKRIFQHQARLDSCEGQTFQLLNKTYQWDRSFLAEEDEVETPYKEFRVAFFTSQTS